MSALLKKLFRSTAWVNTITRCILRGLDRGHIFSLGNHPVMPLHCKSTVEHSQFPPQAKKIEKNERRARFITSQ